MEQSKLGASFGFFIHVFKMMKTADYTRQKTSDFYKENFSERYDNPVFKLPPYENGEHTHEPRGLAKKKAESAH